MSDIKKLPTAIIAPETGPRMIASGKFFRIGDDKVCLRGVSYGPFRPNAAGEPFPEEPQLRADLEHLQSLGFDTVRLYHTPSTQLLALAGKMNLRLIVGLAWTDHEDFLRHRSRRQGVITTLKREVLRLRDHPCVVAFLIGNEIEKTLVRWLGPARVQRFLESLIEAGREIAPELLFSYATYPSTEYLIPRNADFVAFNVYLEQRETFTTYVQRLHHLAGNKPLLISEFGLDVLAHGEAAQAETRAWFEAERAKSGLAGTVWFSYTDEWFRSGQDVASWQFGLVDKERRERPAARLLQPPDEPTMPPFISVIVCTHNGSATLQPCLASLQKLHYPRFEILVIDDGSTQDIASLTAAFPQVRYLHQAHAGLSVARNFGAAQALGEILAYTDDDCLADEDWLTHLAAGFDKPEWVACGGPNIPPAPRNVTECIVAAAPGAPAHVMLNDTEAEHLPGCNLAIRKSALEAIGGFRPQYRTAGDDVDVCWRLRERGGRLRFLPAAMVWHHRRRTFRAYFRQQRGYGKAEALLMKDHPQHFGPLGGARWSGAIYGDTSPVQHLTASRIFHGPRGHGMFQGVYQSGAQSRLTWLSGTLGLGVSLAALWAHSPVLAYGMFALSWMAALDLYRQLPPAPHTLSWHSRLALIGLCWMQPIARETARLVGMIRLGARPSWQPTLKPQWALRKRRTLRLRLGEWEFASGADFDRDSLLQAFRQAHANHITEGDSWERIDLTLTSPLGLPTELITVTEYHAADQRLTRVRATLRLPIPYLLPLATLLWLNWLAGSVCIIALGLIHQRLVRRTLQRIARLSSGVKTSTAAHHHKPESVS